MDDELRIGSSKILAIVNERRQEELIIPAAKELSEKFCMPWILLYLSYDMFSGKDQNENTSQIFDQGMRNGADFVTLLEYDDFTSVNIVCQQHHISKVLVAGKMSRRFIDQLFSLENVNSFVFLRNLTKTGKTFYINFLFDFPLLNVIRVSLLVFLLAGVNAFLHHYFGLLPYHSVGLFFLLEITILGLFFPLFVTIWAAFLASQIWNVFFIPPLFTFSIDSPDDVVLCFSFVVISSIVGGLTNIINKKNRYLQAQGAKTNILYSLSNEIVESQNSDEAVKRISASLSVYFNAYISIAIKNRHGVIDHFKHKSDWKFNNPKNWSAVQWCCDNNLVAGKWTDNIPDAPGICFPLSSNQIVFGVLAFIPSDDNYSISYIDREMLSTVSRQLGLLLEKEYHQQRYLITEKLKESEKIHQTLLNSVSHELKTPLTTIECIAESLENGVNTVENGFREMKSSLSLSVLRLTQVVDNILDMSRIDSGRLELLREWVDFYDVIDNVKDKFQALIGNYFVDITLQCDFPLVYIDATFMEQVFFNLFSNSFKYSPAGSRIKVEASFDEKCWCVIFGDNGPGIKPHEKELIFDKFYRGINSKSGGIGLGMTIVKSIVELHQGTIEIIENDSGLRYRMVFPLNKAPSMPIEV